MFRKDRKSESGRQGGTVSVIGADCVITGDVAGTDGLRVDGRIEGNLRCGALQLGESGSIVGDVEAESAHIAGSVEGKVSVGELALAASARIAGDVSYDSLSIAPGARVDGRFAHRAAIARSAVDAPGPEPKPGSAQLFADAAE